MKKKKRLPISQLREAGKIARQMLVDKGILSKDSTIDKILTDGNTPTLPGIPAYLPHEWTLKAAERMMYDLLIMWKETCERNSKLDVENITDFFKFIIAELRKEDEKYNKETRKMGKLIKSMQEDVPVLKDIFSPMRKKESMKAIQRYFIDSFAVSVALKSSETTSEFANWFLDWSQDLYLLWIKPEDRKNVKRF